MASTPKTTPTKLLLVYFSTLKRYFSRKGFDFNLVLFFFLNLVLFFFGGSLICFFFFNLVFFLVLEGFKVKKLGFA